MNFAPYAVKDMASGAPFGAGTYRLRIKKFEYNDVTDPAWKKAHPDSKSNDPYLQVVTVVQDEQSALGEVVLGRNLFTVLSFKKGADFMLRSLIEACGKDEEWMLVDEDGQPHWDDLVNEEVMGVVFKQPERTDPIMKKTYQERNEVKKFLPLIS